MDETEQQQISEEPQPEPKSSVGRHRTLSSQVFYAAAAIVLAALVVSNVVLWASLTSTRSDLRKARSEVVGTRRVLARVTSDPGLTELSNRVAALESEIGGASSSSDDLASRVDSVEGDVADAQSNVEALKNCVNAYLRGFDRANGGFFTYSFC